MSNNGKKNTHPVSDEDWDKVEKLIQLMSSDRLDRLLQLLASPAIHNFNLPAPSSSSTLFKNKTMSPKDSNDGRIQSKVDDFKTTTPISLPPIASTSRIEDDNSSQ